MSTQNEAILKHLQRRQGITAMEALKWFGCFRLASRIFELRESGHSIKQVMRRVNSKRVAQYWLVR